MVGDQRLCDVCHYLGDMLPATKMVLRQAQKSVYSEKVVTGDTNIFELAPIARQPAALYVIAITAHTRRRRDGG